MLFTNKDGLITARTCTINYPIGTCILYNHAFLRFRAKMKDFWYFLPYNFSNKRYYSLELMMFTPGYLCIKLLTLRFSLNGSWCEDNMNLFTLSWKYVYSHSIGNACITSLLQLIFELEMVILHIASKYKYHIFTLVEYCIISKQEG